ncbi:methylthioribulose-1-phosphate dehydratase-like [Lineus longissimus]|uniref:methylthioribulose-1-phosphate dehydratase-like n=1 Tax=Lineus longissimus TaxID=88925 RepID=UPI00315D0135
MATVQSDDPTVIIPNLCRILQEQGHMVGSSGSISITRDGKTYFTPSGVLKEYIQPNDIFIYKNSTPFHSPPPTKKLKRSSNSPLFEVIYDKTDADTGIHTHCMSSNLITQVTAGNEVRIQNQEMIKGIAKCKSGGMYKNTDELIVPIVENAPEEADLLPAISKAIDDYPETCAVLVRNHGIYVWGKSWQKTKIMYECYCYLFDLMIKMKQLGITRS